MQSRTQRNHRTLGIFGGLKRRGRELPAIHLNAGLVLPTRNEVHTPDARLAVGLRTSAVLLVDCVGHQSKVTQFATQAGMAEVVNEQSVRYRPVG